VSARAGEGTGGGATTHLRPQRATAARSGHGAEEKARRKEEGSRVVGRTRSCAGKSRRRRPRRARTGGWRTALAALPLGAQLEGEERNEI